MKPIMITLSANLYLDDFTKGPFKAETINRESGSIELVVTLNGKAFKASDSQKSYYARSFLIRLGEWIDMNLDSLNAKGIKQIRIVPKVHPLMKRLRSITGQARFSLAGKYMAFRLVIGEDMLVLDVPAAPKRSERSQEHLAHIRQLLKKKA